MLANKFKHSKGEPIFNKRVTGFFIKLFVLFSLWFVCYTMLLSPGRIIDRPLTNFLTASVTKLINIVGPASTPIGWVESSWRPCTHLTKDGVAIFDIFDICNGIDLMFIYLGVLFLLPYPLKRKIIFGIGGVAAIILMNIIRICSLYFIYIYQRSVFDFSHHYLFTLLMYVLIFYGWLLFVKKSKINEQSR